MITTNLPASLSSVKENYFLLPTNRKKRHAPHESRGSSGAKKPRIRGTRKSRIQEICEALINDDLPFVQAFIETETTIRSGGPRWFEKFSKEMKKETAALNFLRTEYYKRNTYLQYLKNGIRDKNNRLIISTLILIDTLELGKTMQKQVEQALNINPLQIKNILDPSKDTLKGHFHKVLNVLEGLGIPQAVAYIIIGNPESFSISLKDGDNGYIGTLQDRRDAFQHLHTKVVAKG